MPRNSSDGFLVYKLSIFFTLYFVQGLPFGLQSRFLPIAFRVKGMSLAKVSLFKLLMIPWLLKAIWAPLIDNYFTRKFWLNSSLICLCLLCFIAAFTTPEYVFSLGVVMFMFNFATAIQDIALDSIVIDSLHSSELAKGNIAQVVGYKLGNLISGGVFAVFTEIISWENIFFTLAFIYILGFLSSVLFLENETMSQSNTSLGDRHESERSLLAGSVSGEEDPNSIPGTGTSWFLFRKTFKCYFWKIFDTPGTTWMLLFLLHYKIGEQGVLNMFPMFMLDSGSGVQAVGFWTGFAGQAFSVLGSILGGMTDPRHLVSNLRTLNHIRGFSVLIIWIAIPLWTSFYFLSYAFSVIALQLVFLTGGTITTIVFTLVMQLSKKVPSQCRASHYTVLITADVLGRLLFSTIVGGLTQWLGYTLVFALFTILTFLVPLQLSSIPSELMAVLQPAED